MGGAVSVTTRGYNARVRATLLCVGSVVMMALCSCFGLDGDATQRLDGPYLILNATPGSDTRLAYDLGDGASIGRVSPRVVALGADENHVIIKWRPDTLDESGNLRVPPPAPNDPALVRYFILERRLDGPHADRSACVRGPYREDEFANARTTLGVSPSLRFSQSFESE